jgi:hypothetical protein
VADKAFLSTKGTIEHRRHPDRSYFLTLLAPAG